MGVCLHVIYLMPVSQQRRWVSLSVIIAHQLVHALFVLIESTKFVVFFLNKENTSGAQFGLLETRHSTKIYVLESRSFQMVGRCSQMSYLFL